MLEANQLTRRFENGRAAFENLSFSIRRGEIVGLVGTSGCGKSSLLRVIAGLDRGWSGALELDGAPMAGISPRVSLIFQEPRLFPWLRVEDNVAFSLRRRRGGAAASRSDARATARQWLDRVGLGGFGRHYPRECSGGMAQRVALARGLAAHPEALLLDEPFSALDAFIRMQLQDLLLSIWRETGVTILLVTHDLDEALHLCDRVLVLRGQPGVLCRSIPVESWRPRHRGDAQLALVKERILEILDLTRPSDPDMEYAI